MMAGSHVSSARESGKMLNVGIRDNERDVTGLTRSNRQELRGEVLFCTVESTMVHLDVVADQGRLPAGTPFVVTAELPGGFLGAVVESVVDRWAHDGSTVVARISRYGGHNRVDLLSTSTRVVLDVETISVPTSRAA